MKRAGYFYLIFLSLASSTTSASSTCLICDSDVWMNDVAKKCFIADMSKYVDEMTSKGSDFVTVSFDTCGKSRGGLMTLPTQVGSSHKSSYVLDKQSLSCLYKLLMQRTASLDPYVVFNLERECK